MFVFSDMEFNEASSSRHYYGYDSEFESESKSIEERQEEREARLRRSGWEADYEVIQRKFRDRGYNKVPEIVFWNLKDSEATPVPFDQGGVALVSRFSKNLMKLFLENGGIINPVTVMHQAITGKMYKKLVVYD